MPNFTPQETRRYMEELLQSFGWQILNEYAEAQVTGRQRQICSQPLSSLEAALPAEFAKGEAAGIDLFRHMPEYIKTEAEAQLRAAERTQDEPEQSD